MQDGMARLTSSIQGLNDTCPRYGRSDHSQVEIRSRLDADPQWIQEPQPKGLKSGESYQPRMVRTNTTPADLQGEERDSLAPAPNGEAKNVGTLSCT